MVWRRMHVPAAFTLRQLHGVIQVAMGWQGTHLFQFHLRAIRYGSWEVAARSPDVTLESLRLRKGARFIYEYDLNIPWRHEVRLEERFESERDKPLCADGKGACPTEDCGGPAGYLDRRDARYTIDALHDLEIMAEIIEKAALHEGQNDLDDANIRSLLQEVVERSEERERCARAATAGSEARAAFQSYFTHCLVTCSWRVYDSASARASGRRTR